jgi:5-methylcytosine-specific restriction endonuclease McrBC GTP-binding regulatory subunit McrB
MESRTAGKPEGECIELHGIRNREVLAIESTDAAPIPIPHEIHIPNNVYFTGTVNVDETTYMFSPKVLDRANVIEFNEVSFSASDPILGDFRLKLDQQEVLNWFHDAETTFCSLDDFRKAVKAHPRFGETVSALKNLLEPFHLHFGYRVANEMARFILVAVERVGAEHLEDAIDIQILQKVLPKFHGTQGKLEEPLTQLKNFCEERGFERSAKKLQRMLKDLSDQGYCSFIA